MVSHRRHEGEHVHHGIETDRRRRRQGDRFDLVVHLRLEQVVIERDRSPEGTEQGRDDEQRGARKEYDVVCRAVVLRWIALDQLVGKGKKLDYDQQEEVDYYSAAGL